MPVELERNDEVMTYFKMLSWHSPISIVRSHENHQT